MANPNLYNEEPIAPGSLNGVYAINLDVSEKRFLAVQFDPLTNPSARLYFRLDQEADPGGATIALLAPQGYLTAGGAVEFWIDPDPTETPYLHLLMTDSIGTPLLGGVSDRVYYLPMRQTPD